MLLVLSSSECKKGSKDCHYEISFQNNYNEAVVFAMSYPGSNAQCMLVGKKIDSEISFEFRPYNWCIENSIGNEELEFYVIDTVSYALDQLYSCDSIEHYNAVLKHFVLTIEDLKSINFTITYP